MMLEYTGSKYKYSGKDYDSFWDALVDMMYDATWNHKKPEFKSINFAQLHKSEKEQYLLIRAMFEWDIVAVLESDDYKSYFKKTHKEIRNGKELLRMNPLWGKRHTMPATYPGNYAMQSAMLPMIDKVFGAWSGSVQCTNGKYPFKKVLSYIADKILFNPETSPFDEVMTIYETLESNKATKSLGDYIRNEDLPKARILAMQVANAELPEQDFISIGSLRKARYACKTKDLWGDSSYMEAMLALPPSMVSDDYYTWLKHAGDASGKDLGLDVERKHEDFQIGNRGLELDGYRQPEEPARKSDSVVARPVVEKTSMPVKEEIQKHSVAAEPVRKVLHEEVSKVLGFTVDGQFCTTIPTVLQQAVMSGDMDFKTTMQLRDWYAKMSRKTVEEKLADVPVLSAVVDEVCSRLPDALRSEIDAANEVSGELLDRVISWWEKETNPPIRDLKEWVESVLGIDVSDDLLGYIPEYCHFDEGNLRSWYERRLQPDDDFGPMYEAALRYCQLHDLDFVVCYRKLAETFPNQEAVYRALPIYVRSLKEAVTVEYMTDYLYALYDVYGSTRIEYKGGV